MIDPKWPIQTRDGYRRATVGELIVLHGAGWAFFGALAVVGWVLKRVVK